jgi:hypothetical protein
MTATLNYTPITDLLTLYSTAANMAPGEILCSGEQLFYATCTAAAADVRTIQYFLQCVDLLYSGAVNYRLYPDYEAWCKDARPNNHEYTCMGCAVLASANGTGTHHYLREPP